MENQITQAKMDNQSENHNRIAIVGMACRFPGAKNYQEFWDNLENGVNSIREIPVDRWDIEEYYSPDIESPNKSLSKWCGIINDVYQFDHKFFNISPREANQMDPQQRLLLEETWHCIEDSGIALTVLQKNKTSVFVGTLNCDYRQFISDLNLEIDSQSCLGGFESILANRLSYYFDLHGASVLINTACSSSLVALHQAKQSLLLKESSFAFVCGVNLNLHPWKYISFSKSRMFSPDGQCKTFDNAADGYVPGDGIGVILLRRYEDAVRDHNHIYGVIKGSGVNHGGRALNITAPRVAAQQEVILSAYNEAGINPETISYIEAHGTGTSLGDPIEVEALTRAFQTYTPKKQFCWIGSLKTNIGHLEGAAGIAGIIKVLLMMRYRKIAASLNIKMVNSIINFESSPFRVAETSTFWQNDSAGYPLRAGVSSFGFGGVNAHILIEEAPAPSFTMKDDQFTEGVEGEGRHLFLLSAKTPVSLENLRKEWSKYVLSKNFQQENLKDICRTLLAGRSNFPYRYGSLISSKAELINFITNASLEPNYSNINRDWCLVIGEFKHHAQDLERLLRINVFRQNYERVQEVVQRFQIVGNPPPDQVLSVMIGYSFVVTLLELGFAPTSITGIKNGLWISLAISGIMELGDVLSVIYGVKELNQIPICRPVIPFFDPLSRRMVMPFMLNHADLRFLMENDRDDLNVLVSYYLPKARLLFTNQFTFRKYMEEWNDELSKVGLEITQLISAGEVPALENDSAKLLLILIILSSLEKLNRKWDLKEEQRIRNTKINMLVDLILGEVISKEELIQLIIESHYPNKELTACLSVFRDLADNQLPNGRKLQPGDFYIDDATSWLQRTMSVESPSNIETQSLVVMGIFANDSRPGSTGINKFLDAYFFDILLKLSLDGVNFDWSKLYPVGAFFNTPLPVYQFDKELFRAPVELSRQNRLNISASTGNKPLDFIKPAFNRAEMITREGSSDGLTPEDVQKEFSNDIKAIAIKVLDLDPESIDMNESLYDYGFTSITFVDYINDINKNFSIKVNLETFFYLREPTLHSFSKCLFQEFKDILLQHYKYKTLNSSRSGVDVDNPVKEPLSPKIEPFKPANSFQELLVLSAENRSNLKKLSQILLDFLSGSGEEPVSPGEILSQAEDDLLEMAARVLKADGSGLEHSSLEEFFIQIRNKYQVSLKPQVGLVIPSIGSLIRSIIKDHRRVFLEFYQSSKNHDESHDLNLENIAFTLRNCQNNGPERMAIIVSTITELVEKLSALAKDEIPSGVILGRVKETDRELLELIENIPEVYRYLFQAGDLNRLGALWVAGARMDWNLLYSDRSLKPIPLLIAAMG